MLNGFYAEKKVFFLSSSSGLELTGLLGGSGLGLIGLYWGSTIFPIHTSPSLYSRVPPPPPRNKLSMHVCQVGGLSFDAFFTGNFFG